MIKVIIADDNSKIRAYLRKVLERTPGFEVVADADNGKKALEQLQQHPADVMLLDVEMPQMSGLQVLEQVKKDQNPVQVFMVSAYADREFVLGSMELGARGYVVKEDALSELPNLLRSVQEGNHEGFTTSTTVWSVM